MWGKWVRSFFYFSYNNKDETQKSRLRKAKEIKYYNESQENTAVQTVVGLQFEQAKPKK